MSACARGRCPHPGSRIKRDWPSDSRAAGGRGLAYFWLQGVLPAVRRAHRGDGFNLEVGNALLSHRTDECCFLVLGGVDCSRLPRYWWGCFVTFARYRTEKDRVRALHLALAMFVARLRSIVSEILRTVVCSSCFRLTDSPQASCSS